MRSPTSTASDRRVRAAAVGGIVGPVGFVGAWVTGAIVTSMTYSPFDDAISRLAAVGADTRWLMTAGFVTFGVALPIYAFALRATVAGPAWIAATVTGIATLGVAAAPLDRSPAVDRLHGVAATIGYVALAATPLAAAAPLRRAGHRRLATGGLAAATTSAVALALTVAPTPTGLFQRVGLTAGDIWIAASAMAIVSGGLVRTNSRRSARTRRSRGAEG